VVADRPGPTARIGPFAFDQWGSFAKRVVMSIFSNNIQRFETRTRDLQVADGEWMVIMPPLTRLLGRQLADELRVP